MARPTSATPVTEEALVGLPGPVARYLRAAGVIGTPIPSTVRVRQHGTFRTHPGGRWMPFTADEFYTTDPPGFLWLARMRMFGIWPVRARDVFSEARGRMTVWPVPGLKAIDETGPPMDQGAALRFLNEMAWFPAAYLRPYIRWDPVDETWARAVITIGEVTASANFRISPEGELLDFVAERYRSLGRGDFERTTWSTPFSRHDTVSRIRVPVEGEGVWHLADGRFVYIRIVIDGIEHEPVSS